MTIMLPNKNIKLFQSALDHNRLEWLEHENEHLNRMLDLAPGSIIVHDRKGKLLYANRCACDQHGYTHEDFLCLTIYDLLLPELAATAPENIASMIDSGETISFEARHVRRDGSTFPLLVNVHEIAWGSERVLMSTCSDLTDQKKVDQYVRDNELKYRTIFEHSPGALLEEDFSAVKNEFDKLRLNGVTDIETFLNTAPNELERLIALIRIVDANKASIRMLGALSHEALLRNLPTFFTDASSTIFQKKLIALFNGAHSFSFEIPVRTINRKELTLSLVFNIVPGHELDWSRVIVSFTDLTALKQAQQTAMQAEKFESLGILAAGIAHDFNNLLNGVFGYIDLARQTTTDQKTKTHLEKAFGVFDRAIELSSQLLTFSKGGAPCLVCAEIGDLLRNTVTKTTSGTDTVPRFDIPSNLAKADVDINQLTQVFRHLSRNAVESMHDGGELYISAVNILPGTDPQAPNDKRHYIRITFTDHGIGIAPEHLQSIFVPLFTKKGNRNGLGLSTSYSIVNRHHGKLALTSAPDVGTSVAVYLPSTRL